MGFPAPSARQQAAIEQVELWGAHNYAPLPVVIADAAGAVVHDIDGNAYLDCLAAYSAVNFGHGHPDLVAAASDQLHRLTLTSRAFHSEPYGPFVAALGRLCGKEVVLPMNTGVEAVETAIKTARKWGYEVKGVPEGAATIVVMEGNFHGRTTTVISFSNDPDARANFAPFTAGFVHVPFGDADALDAAIDAHTVAVLVEPIQGEGGVIVPPEGYLRAVREICSRRGVLMIADEIQSGLGRAGETFACDREGVVPDVYLLGKALGGGIMPVSAVVANRDVLGVFTPGTHGSTFGGNPLACAIGSAVVRLLETGEMQAASRERGAQLRAGLQPLLDSGQATALRQAGLWLGVDVHPDLGTAKDLCYALLGRGVLAKDTHVHTIRLAPPLVITKEQVDEVIAHLLAAFADAARGVLRPA
ncbi:ornithine--oxo-acid transaminase [Propioniciclava sp.]|uniref:ornithine--oxo-acid transaminase n=1 Tax=Propioniciclava sp. TaxID=2038686 RepID=UPI002630779D|nr:ornithine--oxo-acid transaminase [Propioniciclava sp.]